MSNSRFEALCSSASINNDVQYSQQGYQRESYPSLRILIVFSSSIETALSTCFLSVASQEIAVILYSVILGFLLGFRAIAITLAPLFMKVVDHG